MGLSDCIGLIQGLVGSVPSRLARKAEATRVVPKENRPRLEVIFGSYRIEPSYWLKV